MKSQAYLIIDIGTGNVRVAACSSKGEVLLVVREDVNYEVDPLYPQALSFNPAALWEQIVRLCTRVLAIRKESNPIIEIAAITVSSQREGIVLIDKEGKALIGLPNHDHRGREWENEIINKDRIYELTGRYPSSLFSASKLIGLKKLYPELYRKCDSVLSMSDWAEFQLSGIKGYEHSQASETCLYDVESMKWSNELCELFDINPSILPSLHKSGTVLGNVLPHIAQHLDLPRDVQVIVGGADTQLAIKSTQPETGDIVIVSGTTTPLCKITENYILDSKKRTWTNRHIEEGNYILEVNTGVTGLNYQRLKEIFYPNESYEVIEAELSETTVSQCVASLGSLIAEEEQPLTRGGFIFNTPVSNELSRAYFVRSVLWDIACCIKDNYESLCQVDDYSKDYIWACGGGFQSKTLGQFIANLLNKKVLIRKGYRQASVAGGILICNEALGIETDHDLDTIEIKPQDTLNHELFYANWRKTRGDLKEAFLPLKHKL